MATSMKGSEHYVSRPDGRVYYYKVGLGEPLLLLHPINNSGWCWRNVIDRLAEHFTCYNVDLPGFDNSDIPPGKYSVEDFVQATVDVLESAGIKHTSILATHTGAMVSVVLAATYPQRVKRMVFDALPYWSEEEGRAYLEKFIRPQFTDTISYDIPVAPMITWEEAAQNNTNLTKERWEKTEEIKGKSRRWTRLCYEAITNFNMHEYGPKLKVPTLIMFGDGERIRFGEQLANKDIKGSILHVVEGCPGAVHEFKPEELLRLALPFLLNSQ